MNHVKFRLQKKWWQSAGRYSIRDSSGNLQYKSKALGIFKSGIKLMDSIGGNILRVKPGNVWNTAFIVMEDESEIAHVKRTSVWSSKGYTVSTTTDTFKITSKNWGKQINFSREERDIAHASAGGSMRTDVGLVINEDEDAELILSCVVLICYLRTNGSA